MVVGRRSFPIEGWPIFRAYVKLSGGNLSFLRYIGWAHPPSTPPVESACSLGSLVASKKMFMPGIPPQETRVLLEEMSPQKLVWKSDVSLR